MTRNLRDTLIICAFLIAAIGAAYANHFQNEFHFDDFHTITNNPFIRDLHNIPRFFTDPALFSTMPDHQTYRPVVSASLAIDYWLGQSLKPFYFHLSTWFWLAVQLVLMLFLFRRIMDAADPHPTNLWTAAFATAVFGLHPANAETVNYVIQRADLYGTLGVIASLLWFIARPEQRRSGTYLIPAVLAYLSKAPALIYPLILLVYIYLFEEHGGAFVPGQQKKWAAALRAVAPALVVTAIAAVFTSKMTPPAFNAGAASGSLYRLTQPWVALHYFKSFFLPTELSADTDWGYVSSPFSGEAMAGYLFVVLLLWAIALTSRRRRTRPIAFGLLWFLLALLPTSLMPLAEVTNDHRMFFAFVGLALAVFWSLRLVLLPRPQWARAAVFAMVPVLLLAAIGTWQRNRVWRSEESLWRDVTEKSPHNGRGWMNYGLIFMARGDYNEALADFNRSLAFNPNYSTLEINLGVAYGGVHRDQEAESHFRRAILLAPNTSEPYFFYARWLKNSGRIAEAVSLLEAAVRVNPLSFDSRHLLMEGYLIQRNGEALGQLAEDTLRLSPNDETARTFAAARQRGMLTMAAPAPVAAATPPGQSPEALLDLSLSFYQAKRFAECVTAAKQALALRPEYAEAYNNIAAAYNSMGKWDEGIAAAREALRIKPDYQLARNNLLWAVSQRQGKPGR